MNNTLNLSIAQRMAIGFGLLLLILAVFVAAVHRWDQSSATAEDAYTRRVVPLKEATETLERAILRAAIDTRAFLLNPDSARLQRHRQDMDRIRDLVRQLGALPKEPDGDALYRELAPRVESYVGQAGRLVEERRTSTIAAEAELALAEMRALTLAPIRGLADLQEAKARAAIADMESARRKVSDGLAIAVLLVTLSFVGLGVVTTQAVRGPTRELLDIAEALEAGNWQPALAWAPAANGDRHADRPLRNEMLRLGRAFGSAAAALEKREKRLRADRQVAKATASSLERIRVGELALAGIVGNVHAEVGAVYWRERESDRLQPIALHALGAEIGALAADDGVPGQAAKERRMVVVRDIPRDSPFSIRLGYDAAAPRAVAAVPVMFRDELLGMVIVAGLRDFDDEALSFLDAAAAQLGIGLHNVRSHEDTQRLLADVHERNERIQAQNEELQAQGEEIQAQNEELQAQNEEIQGQSEELQAQNEELKAQGDELQTHTRELAEADKRKSDFLGILAHELRNPLAAITNSVYVLARGEADKAHARRAQAVIARQSDHLMRLVEDLLDITRISQAKIRLQIERLDLVQTVRECIEDYGTPLEDGGLVLDLDLPDAPVVVDADRTRLCQVIGNLLSNAIKFSARDQHIGLRIRAHPERRRAALHIVDKGIGIEPDLLGQLFQPFSQGKVSDGRKNSGLGLGLALVKSLVDMHGGSVEAKSGGTNKGAEFIVWMPLQEGVAAVAPAQPGIVTPCRMLIIEDNEDAAESLRVAMELQGHEVRVAHTALEGLEIARAFRPEVLICDIGLPGMDGYEVARRFRADQQLKSAFMIAVTGYAAAMDREQAALAGFDRHLAKPASVERISQTLAELRLVR